MKTLPALLLFVLICFHSVQGQLPDNTSFEQNRAGAPLPFPWFKWGNDEYRLMQDSTTASHGIFIAHSTHPRHIARQGLRLCHPGPSHRI